MGLPLILLRKLAGALFVLAGISVMVFVILRVIPGDPAAMALGVQSTPEQVDALRHAWGLDRSIPEQYLLFSWDLVRGRFGQSLHLGEPALQLVVNRLPATFELALPALVLAMAFSLPLGFLSAVRANSLWDRVISVITLGLQSLPNFWVGLMLILVLARNLGLLPTSGSGTWRHAVLPIISLTLPLLSILVRFVRAGTLEVLGMDYVRTAQSKGLGWPAIHLRHVLKNMLIPYVTVLGLQAGYLLSGVVVVEVVFGWPGLGRLTVDAILRRDYPIVQAGVVVIALMVVLINLAVDLAYTALDPRIRVN